MVQELLLQLKILAIPQFRAGRAWRGNKHDEDYQNWVAAGLRAHFAATWAARFFGMFAGWHPADS